MTCREKLKIEHPDHIDCRYVGGCFSCPDSSSHKYLRHEDRLCEKEGGLKTDDRCRRCWDQEIPTPEQEPTTKPTEQKTSIPSMTDLQWLMRKALGYPGIAVSITFMDDAITFNAYPYPTQEEETNE